MIALLKRLEVIHGVMCNLHCSVKEKSRYFHIGQLIILCTDNDKFTCEEIQFQLIHEYRHALQMVRGMFPEMATFKMESVSTSEEYYNLPWEREANEWALDMGQELGLFPADFVPSWLEGYI